MNNITSNGLNHVMSNTHQHRESFTRTTRGQSIFKTKPLVRAINQHLSFPGLFALTAITIWAPAYAENFPAQVNPSDLDGSNGFVIRGGAGVYGASSVSTAGDFNGDGITDVIIGYGYGDATSYDPTTNASNDNIPRPPGASYIIFGGGGRDQLFGRSGGDTMYGGNGDDAVFGNSGSDKINGGAGANVLNGGNGTDHCVINSTDSITNCD